MDRELNNIPKEIKSDITIATEILKEENCSDMFLFGSLARGTFNKNSDIDIAVKGLSPEKYFAVYSLLAMSMDNKVDLVSLDDSSTFSNRLINSGGLVRVF